MRLRKDNGNVNVFLIILIVIASAFIIFMLNNSSTTVTESKIEDKNSIEDDKVSFNHDTKNLETKNDTQISAKLSNEILSDSGSSAINNSEVTTDGYNRYFYSQLTPTGKSMYNTILKNRSTLIDGYGSIDLNINEENADKYFQTTWDALTLDNPDLFFIDTKKISLLTRTSSSLLFGKVKYSYILQPQNNGNYFVDTWQTSDEVKNAVEKINQRTENIIATVPRTRVDKIKYIHDYLINNMEYNQSDDKNNGDIYGALIKGKAVCEGYAKAFKYFMDKLDVPCVIVLGKGEDEQGNSEFHAWDYVQLDNGEWYAVDCTWDDPIIIGNGRVSDKVKYKYFLVGSDSFFTSHFEDPDVSGSGQNFKYPVISKTNY